ncbi:MAG: hypothetical protein WCS73_06405, partial [Lentisphaeria bacterium]
KKSDGTSIEALVLDIYKIDENGDYQLVCNYDPDSCEIVEGKDSFGNTVNYVKGEYPLKVGTGYWIYMSEDLTLPVRMESK